MTTPPKKITILCSGVALGVYVPALVVGVRLKQHGVATDIVVLESLIKDEKRSKISEVKVAFHRSFKIALAGQKLARDICPVLNRARVMDLLGNWVKEKRRHFIVFSGFWMPIIEAYLRMNNLVDVKVELCHMDASLATSWKLNKTNHSTFRHTWFFNWKDRTLQYRLPISNQNPLPFCQRSDRCLIHGGGWGMGTYREKIADLEQIGVKLDIVCYEFRDADKMKSMHNYLMIDPDWKPWDVSPDRSHTFPPLGRIESTKKIHYQNNPHVPEIYRYVRQNKAIISKPGGATLLDSLSSATPIILLESFGDHEEKNALLWEYLGFGIAYQKWLDSACSIRLLEQLHNNLIQARRKTEVYDAMQIVDTA